MADNYLENKMAEHMAGKRVVRRPAPGPIRFSPLRVLVAGCRHDVAAAVARRLLEAGCRTACAGGAAVPGARCFPADMAAEAVVEQLMHLWHGVDMLVLAGDAPDTLAALQRARAALPAPLRGADPRIVAIDTSAPGAVCLRGLADARAAAGLCLMLAAPDAAPLFDARTDVRKNF